MSVRIHQLSKDLGMENKELIELLKSRGYEVKSASSTVDNISAEALLEEFAAQAPQPAEPEPEAPVAPKLPEGAFVKSAADIDREHQKKAVTEEAEKAAKAPKQVSPATSPSPPTVATPPSSAISPKAPNPIPTVSTPTAAPTPAGPPKPPATAQAADVEQAPAAESIEGEGPEASVAEAGKLKKIHVKPPIVVRDFAGEIGLKPSKNQTDKNNSTKKRHWGES
jgi:translation initiation factor IF-2